MYVRVKLSTEVLPWVSYVPVGIVSLYLFIGLKKLSDDVLLSG